MTPAQQRNLHVFTAWLDGFNNYVRKDGPEQKRQFALEMCHRFAHEECDNAYRGTKGKEGALSVYTSYDEWSPDRQIEILAKGVGGPRQENLVFFHCRLFGTHTGPLDLGGTIVPSTGKNYSIKFVDVIEMKDGLMLGGENSDVVAALHTLPAQLGLSGVPDL